MCPSTTQAVRNNAEWCDAVCAARGAPGTFSQHLWVSGGAPPPYYPNIITLAPSSPSLSAALAKAIDSLGPHVSQELSVKDSFGDTDLSALGFRVFFEAQWFGRPGRFSGARSVANGVQWMSVRSERDLTAWKRAWDAAILKVDPVFLPPLLHDENVLFMCARRGDDIVAGAVANRHAEAVGLSNYFARGPASNAYRADCVSMAMARFPGLPLVGYQQQTQRSAASGAEFTSLGPLRVWVTGKAR